MRQKVRLKVMRRRAFRVWTVVGVWAFCSCSYGQKVVPLGNGALLHFKIYYMTLDAETRGRITPGALRKVGDIIEVRDAAEIRGLRNLLRDARVRAETPPQDLRMLIEVEGQKPVYMDGNGDISQGKLTWQMEPADFLRLYFQMEDLDKAAVKRK